MFQVEMMTAAGELVLVGGVFASRHEAEAEMTAQREAGMYTDGRDVGGGTYPANRTRVVEVEPVRSATGVESYVRRPVEP